MKKKLTIPGKFYCLLENICKIKNILVGEAVIDGLINFLGSELETPIGCYLGKEIKSDSPGHYWEYVKSLAYPEEEAKEEQV